MTVEDIKRKIQDIEKCSGDDERAHQMEDDLYKEVLLAISLGHPNCYELAVEALKASSVGFCRWYA